MGNRVVKAEKGMGNRYTIPQFNNSPSHSQFPIPEVAIIEQTKILKPETQNYKRVIQDNQLVRFK